MSVPLRAVILGAGQAGQGHALALRHVGVSVVGMTGRTADHVAATARKLGIPAFGTDWHKILTDLRPEIAVVATPGGTHREMIGAALEVGCHVVAEKPLATNAADAHWLFDRSREAGVKTAYGASFWYQPQALLARKLVQDGVIGQVLETECVSHSGWPATIPFGWPHRLDQGGGRLNNGFPHMLAVVHRVLGGEILSVIGEARCDLKRAPVGGSLRDFREFAHRPMTEAEAARWNWADADSDWSFTAVVRIGDPARTLEDSASCIFRHSALRHGWPDDYTAIYGDRGTIHIRGGYMQGGVYLKTDGPTWEQIGLPPDLRDLLPEVEDNTLRNWICLARDFVNDIQGQPVERYLTFRDGWIYQEVIDAIRHGSTGTPMPRT